MTGGFMHKSGNLHLQIDDTLGVIEENNVVEVDAVKIKHNKVEQKNEQYGYQYQVTNFIREEVVLAHRPPKGSLSELVFLNQLDNLIKRLECADCDANAIDATGSTHSWTPLYWAVKMRRIECMAVLLNHGVNINIVVNDSDECCGTVLDLATLRDDSEIEEMLREFAEKEDVNLGQSFKAIRTKLRGKAPAFNFRYYSKKKNNEAA